MAFPGVVAPMRIFSFGKGLCSMENNALLNNVWGIVRFMIKFRQQKLMRINSLQLDFFHIPFRRVFFQCRSPAPCFLNCEWNTQINYCQGKEFANKYLLIGFSKALTGNFQHGISQWPLRADKELGKFVIVAPIWYVLGGNVSYLLSHNFAFYLNFFFQKSLSQDQETYHLQTDNLIEQ